MIDDKWFHNGLSPEMQALHDKECAKIPAKQLTEDIIAARLAEIDARERVATPGPWTDSNGYGDQIFAKDEKGIFQVAQVRGWGHFTGKGNGGLALSDNEASKIQDANSAFIAQSRDDVPWLRDLVKELQACNNRQAQLLKDAQVGWAADVASLSQERDTAYMDGVKKTIYEIFKEADIPGSQAIRDSGDTDDGMCAQAAQLLTTERDAYKRAKEYWDALRGQGYEIANWHMNGALEPFDSFWRSAQDEFEKGDSKGNE